MLVFTHIPRTGGTSLRNVISNQIANCRFIDSFSEFSFLSDKELNSYDFIATHCGYGIFNSDRVFIIYRGFVIDMALMV